MDKLLRFLFILINLHRIFHHIRAEEYLQQKFTSKCDDLCIDQSENDTKVGYHTVYSTQSPFACHLIDFSNSVEF